MKCHIQCILIFSPPQGQAISVLVRAHLSTGDSSYLEAATRCVLFNFKLKVRHFVQIHFSGRRQYLESRPRKEAWLRLSLAMCGTRSTQPSQRGEIDCSKFQLTFLTSCLPATYWTGSCMVSLVFGTSLQWTVSARKIWLPACTGEDASSF